MSIAECEKACMDKVGCNFFVFGTGSKDGKCYWEKTSTADCPEGWKQNDYNFYETKSMQCQVREFFHTYISVDNSKLLDFE